MAQLMGIIVPRFMDFDESDTTLELMDVCTKETLFFSSRPLNFVNYDLINARCNEIASSQIAFLL
jgi:hypothetical protein